MRRLGRRKILGAMAAGATVLAAPHVRAARNYAPGVSDSEIKVGQTMAYSGPASSYAAIGKSEAAYFRMINDQGGVNGRKITLLSRDDGYSPPKTVEVTRALVEQDEVAFIYQSLGTATSAAVQRYLNGRKIPQLFVASGAGRWDDPQHFPWTTGWQPSYPTEATVFAKNILATRPNAKVAVLYQNDDLGHDYHDGLARGFGDGWKKLVVGEATFEATDPTVDSQIVSLAASGADTFVVAGLPRAVAQAIRKAYDIGWKPQEYLPSGSNSVSSVLQPAGLEKAAGAISVGFLKDPTDPQWAKDAGFQEWLAFMGKYYPDGNKSEFLNGFGQAAGGTLVQVLKQCGDDLSRDNIMRQAKSLDAVPLPMLLPGITINTSATNLSPIRQMRLLRFNGRIWEVFGDMITA